MPCSVRYCFSQRFSVSAREAYDWCTDYTAQDHALMGNGSAERKITRVAEDTVILTDIFHVGTGVIEKQKLVQFYPDCLCWVATHLSGPNKYSQFIYEISTEGDDASRLDFTAVHLEYAKLDSAELESLAGELKAADSAVWKLLAEAMAREFGSERGDKEKP